MIKNVKVWRHMLLTLTLSETVTPSQTSTRRNLWTAAYCCKSLTF